MRKFSHDLQILTVEYCDKNFLLEKKETLVNHVYLFCHVNKHSTICTTIIIIKRLVFFGDRRLQQKIFTLFLKLKFSENFHIQL